MSSMQEQKQNNAREWLVAAIWSLTAVITAGIIVGAVLLNSIYQASGWKPLSSGTAFEEQVPIYSQEQIDRFITSVLVTVQNAPLTDETAPQEMLFVATFNAYSQKLSVAAFMSDILVTPEGYGEMTLGEVCAKGGPGLLVNVMNEAFGLDLQYYACTDAASLAAMIDLLGGVRVTLTAGEAGYINDALQASRFNAIKPGDNSLTGSQCMVYAMDALSGTEAFGSARRQLRLIDSAVSNMRQTATKAQMLPLLTLVSNSIRTNLDLMTLRNIGYEILKAEEMEYEGLLLPCEGSWAYTMLNGKKVLRVNLPKNAKYLREVLYKAM